MIKKDSVKLLFSLLLSLLAGFIGSIFTADAIETWYVTLNKPWFTPPDWAFSPVWITLYILMGVSLYMVWKQGFERKNVKVAMVVFAVQLVLNASWSYLFFGLRSPLLGLVGISFLWVAIVATIYTFYRVYKKASYILIPYILWVTLALLLNLYIYLYN